MTVKVVRAPVKEVVIHPVVTDAPSAKGIHMTLKVVRAPVQPRTTGTAAASRRSAKKALNKKPIQRTRSSAREKVDYTRGTSNTEGGSGRPTLKKPTTAKKRALKKAASTPKKKASVKNKNAAKAVRGKLRNRK
jgi:hypothetical protein